MVDVKVVAFKEIVRHINVLPAVLVDISYCYTKSKCDNASKDPSLLTYIHKVIFMATPHQGFPEDYKTFESGSWWDFLYDTWGPWQAMDLSSYFRDWFPYFLVIETPRTADEVLWPLWSYRFAAAAALAVVVLWFARRARAAAAADPPPAAASS